MRAAKMRFAIGLAVLAGCHSKTSGTPDAGTATLPVPSSSVSPVQAAMDMMTASATAGPRAPNEAGNVANMPKDVAERLAAEAIDGGVPAHPFFIGPFGPSPLTVFGIVQTDPMSTFTPVAEAFHGDDLKPLPIEPMTDTPWNGWKVDAVLFDAIDTTKVPSPIVIAEYMTGIGPDGAKPFSEVIVYRWTGGKFVRAKTVEKKLEGATNAAEVRKRLEPLKKGE